MRLVVVPLGDLRDQDVKQAVERQFGAVDAVCVDRRALLALVRGRCDAAVLVAPDLESARLRLTSLLLALPRAKTRWRIDVRGGRERWTLTEHLRQNTLPIARHLLACGVALLLGEPLLRALDATITPRQSNVSPPPKRVLYLRSQLWLGLAGGGSVAHTAGVIGGLQECGVHVHVVSSDQLMGVTAATSVVRPEVWFDGWARELEELAYNVAFLARAARAALKLHPDLIYQRHTTFNVAGAVLSRVLRVPLALEFNSSEVWKGRYWGGLRLSRAAALVERINLRAADRIVVVSRVLRDELAAAGVPASKILVNPNAVDTRVFTPEVSGGRVRHTLGIASEDVVVGFSGTFGAWHGIPTLARALPKVGAERPNARWLLLGDGPLMPSIERAITANGLQQRVSRVGLVPHADMPRYLAACDIFVAPHGRQADGRDFFGSPTKLYEYMAMGRPIVASRVGQIAEVLADEVSALLVPPDDPEALTESIVRLIDDACLRLRLGRAARQAAEARHTWRHNAERLMERPTTW